MLAAVLYGANDLRIEEVEEPKPGAGQAKIRIAACGICGSDLHMYRGAGWAHRAPHIIGHEFAGTVVEVGSGVDAVSVGDAVSVRPLIACGTCVACTAGYSNACVERRFHGLAPDLAGGMAEYAVVDASNLHRLPHGLSPERAALVEPIAVGVHAARRGLEQGGENAVILGGGPIGIATFLAFKTLGLHDVVVVEPSERRRAAVRGVGATVVVDPTADDVRDHVLQMTNGLGADICIDAAGVPQTFTDAQTLAARRGRVVLVAGYEKAPTFDPNHLTFTEQSITAAFAYDREDFEIAVETALGLETVDSWVGNLDLSDLVSGFEQLSEQRAVKLLVTP